MKKRTIEIYANKAQCDKWLVLAKKKGMSRSQFLVSLIEEKLASPNANNVSAEWKEKKFEKFWVQYPNKKVKQNAKKSFMRLLKKEILAIFDVYEDHLVSWHGKEKKFIPHPSTWINQKRWEDEVDSYDQKFILKNSKKLIEQEKERESEPEPEPEQLSLFGKILSKLKS